MENISNQKIDGVTYTSKGIPKNLHVLTILTFIGSGFAIVGALLTPVLIPFLLKFFDKIMAGSSGELPADKLKQLEETRSLMELQQTNMIPLMITGLVGAVLCIAGAIMMRKFKKDGFWLYVAGQLIPIIAMVTLMGGALLKNTSSIGSMVLPIIFIFVYYSQRKFFTK